MLTISQTHKSENNLQIDYVPYIYEGGLPLDGDNKKDRLINDAITPAAKRLVRLVAATSDEGEVLPISP